MKTDPYNDRESITELLKQYNGLRNGQSSIFLEEEAFETIIDYFDELEDVRAIIKKSTDNKASKKMKDSLFDEGSGNLKDSMQKLMDIYGDGSQTA